MHPKWHELTSVDLFRDTRGLGAFVGSIRRLTSQYWATSIWEAFTGIHSFLKWISFPTKNVIGVLSVASSGRQINGEQNDDLQQIKTYGSPMLKTKGCLEPLVHRLLNSLVSHTVSSRISGSETGWVLGHLLLTVYATWDLITYSANSMINSFRHTLWSGESRFTPSQHLDSDIETMSYIEWFRIESADVGK